MVPLAAPAQEVGPVEVLVVGLLPGEGGVQAVRRRRPQSTVSCPLCWCSVVEGNYSAHYQWHIREGHVDEENSAQEPSA